MSNEQDREIRHLRETIAALRDELERIRFEEREHSQRALSAANDEIRQLRSSVAEMRDRLELQEVTYQEKFREAELQHHRERTELHETIAALREKLEELHHEGAEHKDQAKTASTTSAR